ncbi:uncharacterized protein MONBRDRAFT_39345 [Monosiga brevicollis MX1]|uniref:RRP12 HEAT domain-containing protein n=1 Tax=Monosiga brevicollis TaxID=81824 RepID=A9VDX5_MONBE|nr:uncharacterized protein MONBRDRAFT_39345 [Monosiga brevicollis MX1]EDQ84279.1 predicted protein [Monosiga brevicollis MX1]|eukprot:XP_001750909.1 hypothetical protein [Monosiga brevicollis MX1]
MTADVLINPACMADGTLMAREFQSLLSLLPKRIDHNVLAILASITAQVFAHLCSTNAELAVSSGATLVKLLVNFFALSTDGAIRAAAQALKMHETDAIGSKGAFEAALKTAADAIGLQAFFTLLPLDDLLSPEPKTTFRNVWLLTLVKEGITNDELQFFGRILLPMAQNLRRIEEKAVQLNEQVIAKTYNGLYLQIWELLPSICNAPTDTPASFPKLAKLLGERLTESEPVCELIAFSLSRLIKTTATGLMLGIAPEALRSTFFKGTAKKLLEQSEANGDSTHKLMELILTFAPHIAGTEQDLLYRLLKPMLLGQDEVLQKKSYRGLMLLADRETDAQTVLVNEKTRHAAYDTLTMIGYRFIDEATPEMNLQTYFTMVVAGLAGRSPHMLSATVLGLSRLVYMFFKDLESEFAREVIIACLSLLESPAREVQKSALGFAKMLTTVLNAEDLQQLAPQLLESISLMKEADMNHLKMKMRVLFERLIRKLGFDQVASCIQPSQTKLLQYVHKQAQRKQKSKPKRARGDGDDSDDDGDDDLDFMPTAAPAKDDMEEDQYDLLSTSVGVGTSARQSRKGRQQEEEVEEKDGKFVFKEDDSGDEAMSDDDDDEGAKKGGKGITMGTGIHRDRRPTKEAARKPKKSALQSDARRKGQAVQPYAYVALDQKILNKRRGKSKNGLKEVMRRR